MKKVTLQVDLEVPDEWSDRQVEGHFQEWLRDLECHYREKLMSTMAESNSNWPNDIARKVAIEIYTQDVQEVKAAVLSVRV